MLAKAELAEVVAFLKKPERFATVGARMPRGVILWDLESGREELTFDRHGGQADVSKIPYTAEDIRYTASKDGRTLYVGAFQENRIYAYAVQPDGSTGGRKISDWPRSSAVRQ